MKCTLLIGVGTFVVCATGAALAGPAKVDGEAQKLGDGFAKVYAELDA